MPIIVYYIIVTAILFAGAKYAGFRKCNEDFMSLRESKAIQAICAILIIFHHTSQKVEYCEELQYFVNAGILFVAIFMFCSGYGLIKSMEQKENYLDHFLKKRLVTVLIPFYLINTIYVLYSAWNQEFTALQGKDLAKELAFRLSGIKLASGNEWFMVVIAFLYLFFYLFFKYLKQPVAFVLMAVVIIAYSVFGVYRDHNSLEWWVQGEWWYNTVSLFYFGLLFAKFEKTLLKGMRKVYYVITPVAIIGAVYAYKFANKILYTYSYYGEFDSSLTRTEVLQHRGYCLGTQILAMVVFVLAVLLVMMKMHFDNAVLGFLGKISLEIYLIHDLFLMFYHSDHCNLLNPDKYVTAILASTLVAATILWFVSSKIIGLILKKR